MKQKNDNTSKYKIDDVLNTPSKKNVRNINNNDLPFYDITNNKSHRRKKTNASIIIFWSLSFICVLLCLYMGLRFLNYKQKNENLRNEYDSISDQIRTKSKENEQKENELSEIDLALKEMQNYIESQK